MSNFAAWEGHYVVHRRRGAHAPPPFPPPPLTSPFLPFVPPHFTPHPFSAGIRRFGSSILLLGRVALFVVLLGRSAYVPSPFHPSSPPCLFLSSLSTSTLNPSTLMYVVPGLRLAISGVFCWSATDLLLRASSFSPPLSQPPPSGSFPGLSFLPLLHHLLSVSLLVSLTLSARSPCSQYSGGRGRSL